MTSACGPLGRTVFVHFSAWPTPPQAPGENLPCLSKGCILCNAATNTARQRWLAMLLPRCTSGRRIHIHPPHRISIRSFMVRRAVVNTIAREQRLLGIGRRRKSSGARGDMQPTFPPGIRTGTACYGHPRNVPLWQQQRPLWAKPSGFDLGSPVGLQRGGWMSKRTAAEAASDPGS